MKHDDHAFIVRMITMQSGWTGTPEQRHQLINRWLRDDRWTGDRIRQFTENMPLMTPRSGAEEVIDALEQSELARNVNALAILLKNINYSDYDSEDQSKVIIEKLARGNTSAGTSVTFDVPYAPNEFFSGREDIVTSLRNRYIQNNKLGFKDAVTGLGGIGKTQVALAYAYKYRLDYQYIFWISGDTLTSLSNGYENLASLLGLPKSSTDDPQRTIKSVVSWLNEKSNYLLVIDNLDEPDSIANFLPPQPHGHVLMTSQRQNLDKVGVFDPVSIGSLSLEHASSFLVNRVFSPRDIDIISIDMATVEALARALDCFPLALEQAAAYIRLNGMEFSEYLSDYIMLKLRLLDEQGPVVGDYHDTVRTTWWKGINKVRETSSASVDLMTLCSFLDSDKIPAEIMFNACDFVESIKTLFSASPVSNIAKNRLIQPLENYSLIQRDNITKTFDVHRMVQAVVRDSLSESDFNLWLDNALLVLSFDKSTDIDFDLKDANRFISHWVVCSSYNQSPASRARVNVLYLAGRYYKEKANYAAALPLYQKADEILTQLLGEKNHEVLSLRNSIAVLYYNMGSRDEAFNLAKKIVSVAEHVDDKNDVAVAQYLDTLSYLYMSRGEYSMALPLRQRCVEIYDKAYYQGDLRLPLALNGLAELYYRKEQYSHAEALYTRSFNILKSYPDTHRLHLAAAVNGLGHVHKGLKNFDMAINMYRDAMNIYIEYFDTKLHPHVATTIRNIALVYQMAGNVDEAIQYCEQSLEIRESKLPANHPDIINSLRLMAELYKSADRIRDEKSILERLQKPGLVP